MNTTLTHLLEKYNVPVPRYTSYPTVPFWKEPLDVDQWKTLFRDRFRIHNHEQGISLYLHLPFCESLCTYCGCNKKITTNHQVEREYLERIIREWRIYRDIMGEPPIIREIHLGGGTPTFFSPANLARLMDALFEWSVVHPRHEFSVEGHPNNTTRKHLETLYGLGFRRISFGVQDHDPEVQRIINRIQPVENVERVTRQAREIGFESVNFDLIYGLPRQTLESMERTILQSIDLRPDRIAFYSYAHVPWTSRGQRLFDESDLPSPALKMQLYQLGRQLFTAHGYLDVGMDHFALPGDALVQALEQGTLHRNFMGYTTQNSAILLGLGVSAISDAGTAFAQNHKRLHEYYESIDAGQLAVAKGYFLNEEDMAMRRYILDISCRSRTQLAPEDLPRLQPYTLPALQDLQQDGLVRLSDRVVEVTPLGRHFLRNICHAFDQLLLRQEASSQNQPAIFSKAI